MTAPWLRNEHGALSGVKSTSYAENVRALAYATERAATEAIFLNTVGNVSEGTGSNLFLIFGSEVVTPPLAAGPLAGITRELLLEWCPIAEADVTAEDAGSSRRSLHHFLLAGCPGGPSLGRRRPRGTRATDRAAGQDLRRAGPRRPRSVGRLIIGIAAATRLSAGWDKVGVALRGEGRLAQW